MKAFDEFRKSLPVRLSGYEHALCERTWDFQQAKIDRLMFEHCPDEMTQDQLKKFEEHQE